MGVRGRAGAAGDAQAAPGHPESRKPRVESGDWSNASSPRLEKRAGTVGAAGTVRSGERLGLKGLLLRLRDGSRIEQCLGACDLLGPWDAPCGGNINLNHIVSSTSVVLTRPR